MSRRAGMTLLELLVSAGLSTLLLGGLAGAMFVASSSLRPAAESAPHDARAAHVLAQFSDDLRHARRFVELTARSAVVEVPDRNADGQPETLAYRWSGEPGDPLRYASNGGAEALLVDDVQSFALTPLNRPLTAESTWIPRVHYEGFAEAATSSKTTWLQVPRPVGAQRNDLLVTALAFDKSPGSVWGGVTWNVASSGQDPKNEVTLVVMWRLKGAGDATSYQFNWSSSTKAHACTMRFTGHDRSAPIGHVAATGGMASASAGTLPLSPEVTAPRGNSLILRLAAFDGRPAASDRASIPDHELITLDGATGSDAVMGGALHRLQDAAGPSGSGTYFELPPGEFAYRSATLAINPSQTP